MSSFTIGFGFDVRKMSSENVLSPTAECGFFVLESFYFIFSYNYIFLKKNSSLSIESLSSISLPAF